jgi:hypothetical protein
MKETLLNEIEKILENIAPIPDNRRYWLVRTQSGSYYSSYLKYDYIALGHNEIKLSDIDNLRKVTNNDEKLIFKELKKICESIYNEESRPGLIASQIFRFVFEIKKGDIVIIPSENSEDISIGTVSQTPVLQTSEIEMDRTECPFNKRKSVVWNKSLSRDSLDPYLYRVLQAHQAINDIGFYGETIERTLGNFFIKNNAGNLVLDVATTDGINAKELFQLGYYLLNYSEDFFNQFELPFNTNDIEVKINLNSKGKIQFKSPNPKLIWLIAVLIVGLAGGGLQLKLPKGNFNLSTDGLIKSIINYQNNAHDREMTDKIMESIDSLKVQSPDDAVTVFQQFSANKNLPK